MGILGALSTAVSGLSAQSYALENISGNIANTSTVGFKRVDTSFVDLVPDQPAKQELSGSVSAHSQLTNTIQGTLSTTGIATNVALSGSGYFSVSQNNGTSQDPSFAARNLYTRRGDFAQDAQGFLVNGAGYYVDGTTFNPSTGAAVGVTNSPIKLSTAPLAAQATSKISYQGNLASVPKPTNFTANVPSFVAGGATAATAANNYAAPTVTTTLKFTIDGSAKSATVNAGDPIATAVSNLNAAAGSAIFTASGGKIALSATSTVAFDTSTKAALGFTSDPPVTVPTTITGANSQNFLDSTVSGGQVTVYSSTGSSENLQLRWGKVSNADAGASVADTWQLYGQVSASATGGQTAWQSLGTATFSSTGQLTSLVSTSGGTTSNSTITASNLSVNGTSVGNVSIDFSGGLTQYGDSNGVATANLNQNGFTSGSLTSVAVASDGSITGSYSNGQTTKLAQLTVAQFSGNDSLKREAGGAFSATAGSGVPTFGLNGSTITGGSVEGSNTDISDEFSKMIVTQQAYSANTKVMSTAQTMLQDIINIIR